MEVQISFRGMSSSPAMEQDIREHFDRLERLAPATTQGRAVVERPQAQHHRNAPVTIRLEIHVPGETLVASHTGDADPAHQDPRVTIRHAFEALKRQVQDHNHRVHGEVKSHSLPSAD